MDKAVEFAIQNIEKTLNLVNENEQYKKLKNKVRKEYYYIKAMKTTGNLYEYYLKFKNNSHKYAKDFAFLKDYGIISNEEMAEYLEKNYPEELNNYTTIEDLKINEVYSNNEIRVVFKGSDRGGMRRSKETNTLVLICKHNNALYDDSWSEDGTLLYTGEGQEGDQRIDCRQNLTLAKSNENGVKVYLFESYEDNKYYFRGQVYLAGEVFTTEEKDINGDNRVVIKFPLKRVNNDEKLLITYEDQKISEEIKEKEVKKLTKEELKKSAKNVKLKKYNKEVIVTYRERNQLVSRYTKERTNGKCDLCKSPAPFENKDGIPFLENHHVITLAEGGPDVIYNTVALCPNCHRKMHILKDKKDIETLIDELYKYLLEDDDTESLEQFRKLFKK